MAMETESGNHLSENASRQTYLLVRRDAHGYFRKVETFDKPPTPRQVLEKFGEGHYVLRSCHPRFITQWKGLLGNALESKDKESEQEKNIVKLKRRTTLLGIGLVGSFATQALGFGLSHSRFQSNEQRLAQVEAQLGSFSIQGIVCPLCSTPVRTMLQKFCTGCRA